VLDASVEQVAMMTLSSLMVEGVNPLGPSSALTSLRSLVVPCRAISATRSSALEFVLASCCTQDAASTHACGTKLVLYRMYTFCQQLAP